MAQREDARHLRVKHEAYAKYLDDLKNGRVKPRKPKKHLGLIFGMAAMGLSGGLR